MMCFESAQQFVHFHFVLMRGHAYTACSVWWSSWAFNETKPKFNKWDWCVPSHPSVQKPNSDTATSIFKLVPFRLSVRRPRSRQQQLGLPSRKSRVFYANGMRRLSHFHWTAISPGRRTPRPASAFHLFWLNDAKVQRRGASKKSAYLGSSECHERGAAVFMHITI